MSVYETDNKTHFIECIGCGAERALDRQ